MPKSETNKTAEEIRDKITRETIMAGIEYVSGKDYTGSIIFHIQEGRVQKVEYNLKMNISDTIQKTTMRPLP